MNLEVNLPLRHCPICNEDLPIDRFGIACSRKDGRNLYCKGCICAKVNKSREALREYRSAQKKRDAQKTDIERWKAEVKKSVKEMSPVERVREAIRSGPKTQREIAIETKLHKDEIGDALAILLLENGEIRTEGVDYSRIYLMNDQSEVKGVKAA